MAFQDEPTDKWVVKIISSVANKLVGKKGAEKIAALIVSSGILGKLVSKAKTFLGDVKTGVITDFINWASAQKIEARAAGGKVPSWAKLLKDWYTTPKGKEWSEMTKGEKAKFTAGKVASVIGLVGAVITAADTIGTAVSYGQDDLKRDDKNAWQWFWDTSIPGATVNMVAKWFGHGRKKSSSKEEADKAISTNKSTTRINKYPIDKTVIEYAKKTKQYKQGYQVANYMQAAAEEEMEPTPPSNPQAYNEWKKEVEMRKKTNYGKTNVSKTNDISWYNRGQASKLNAGTLTWSAVKVAKNKFTFVLCSKASVAILMPAKGSSIHSRIKQNMNVLFQALRGKNTGAFNYEEEDVFNYCYALSSLIARIRYLQKVFKLCNKHDVLVDNLHVALTDAAFPGATSGAAYADYCKNAPNYISRLNSLVEEINTYALPANTLISRWNYIADKGFKDYNGNQAVYCYYAIDIYPRFLVNATRIQLGNVYQTASGTNPIDIVLTELETDVHTFRTLGTAAAPATASNVMVKISGDMIKLLGAKPSTFKNVDYFLGNPVQTFEYDVEAIDQLRNAKMFPLNTASTYGDYNTASNIMCILKTRQSGHYASEIINSHWVDGERLVTTERAIAAIGPENVQLVQFNWIGTAVQDAGDNTQANVTCTDYTATILVDILNKYYINGSASLQTGHIEPFISLGATPRVVINGVNGQYTTPVYMQMKAQLDYIPEPDVLEDASGFQYAGQAIDVDNFAWLNATQFDEMLNVTAYSLTYYFDPEQLNIQGIIG